LPDNRGMLELLFIRHGETDWNRELRFQGQVDVPLNATGHEQARRLGERLASEPVHRLYSSDLTRTVQTAGPAAERLRLPSVGHVALREQAFGLIDGMSVPDIQQQHPGIWERWLAFDPDYAPPGGESQRQFQARVLGAMAGLAQRHASETLVGGCGHGRCTSRISSKARATCSTQVVKALARRSAGRWASRPLV
jgi:probable phosphoglycerate mutase